MILFILLIILMIAGWVFFGTSVKLGKEGLASLFLIIGLAATGGSLGGIVVLGNRNCDAYIFKADRDYYQELAYNLSDDMSFETVSRTINKAKSINERIEKDRRHCDNAFYGTFYNSKIAEVELIEIPELSLKGFNKKFERDF